MQGEIDDANRADQRTGRCDQVWGSAWGTACHAGRASLTLPKKSPRRRADKGLSMLPKARRGCARYPRRRFKSIPTAHRRLSVGQQRGVEIRDAYSGASIRSSTTDRSAHPQEYAECLQYRVCANRVRTWLSYPQLAEVPGPF